MSSFKKTVQWVISKRLHPKLPSKSVFQEHGLPRGLRRMLSSADIGRSLTQEAAYAHNWHATYSISHLGILRKGIQNHTRTLSMQARSIEAECWSCGRSKSEKGFVICPSCNAVQAPDPDITYFEIFEQDPRFDLDKKVLEAKYKSLMKKLHPDLTHGKSAEEKENYAYWSALITTAYTELLRPVSRATYLLKLRAILVEEEGTVADPDLIMEVMEIKETLQSKPERAVLVQLQKQASARMEEWSHAFKTALEEGDDRAAISSLQRMSYFGRVCDDIHRELL